MKKCWIAFFYFAVLSTALPAQDAWKEYVHKENQMAFSMPDDPVANTQVIDSALGKLTLNSYIYEKGSYALMVMTNVYPDKVLQAPSDKLLNAARDGAVNNIQGKVTSQKAITIDGHPGLEFEFESSKYFGTYRLYLVGTSLYQVGYIDTLGSLPYPDADRFLNSFRLVTP